MHLIRVMTAKKYIHIITFFRSIILHPRTFPPSSLIADLGGLGGVTGPHFFQGAPWNLSVSHVVAGIGRLFIFISTAIECSPCFSA